MDSNLLLRSDLPWPLWRVLRVLANAVNQPGMTHEVAAAAVNARLFAAEAEALASTPPSPPSRIAADPAPSAAVGKTEMVPLLSHVGMIDAPAPSAATPDEDEVGERIARWTTACFGPGAMARQERAERLLEEAIELAQAEGMARPDADRLLAHVYSKPVGSPSQEAAGVGLCLAAWGRAAGESVAALTLGELRRVEGFTPEHFRERHARKVAAGAARPVAAPAPEAGTREEET